MIHEPLRAAVEALYAAARQPRPCIWRCRACGQPGRFDANPAEVVRAHLAAWHGGG